jgi:hypothetical protein
MRSRAILIASLLALALAIKPAWAERVDLQLVLAVDISGSVDSEEAKLQRDGYVQALTHPAVLAAIQSGPLKRIGVTYVEWAGDHYQEILADWAVIDGPESAQAFAGRIARQPIDTAQWTSISAVIRFGMDMFDLSPFQGSRRVIDISGDGANNNGETIIPARDRAVAKGIIINGLPIVNGRSSRYGMPQIPNLDEYYRDCVIGGPGSFLIVANGFTDFARAIRRKMILEIAGLTPPPAQAPLLQLAQFQPKKKRDCLDGERWLRQHFEDP